MRKILFGLILIGLLISTLGFSQYRVNGTQIYNGSNPVVMKGTNVNGPNWVWGRETTQDANLIVDTWKFNIVRTNQFLYGARISTNNNLDLIINTFTAKGCVVMIEVHDFTGTEPTDAQLNDLKNFWIDKATKYKNNDKVWFNIENEPVDGWNGSVSLTTRWRDVHDQCIGVIRAAGANNICVCDDNGWGAGAWNDAQSGIMTYGQFLTSKYSNIAFGVHLYDDRISVANLTAWFNSMISKGLCPIVGEFGVDNGAAWPNAPTNLFSILHNTSNSQALQNVGRLSWHWASGDANRYCNTGDGNGYDVNQTNGITRPTNLVANFGGLIWDDSHSGTPLNVAVTGVTVSPTSASIAVGATTQLTATVSPSNATNKTVSWSSSNTSAATVSSSGLVTGVAAGTATITVTTQDQGKTATASISVNTTNLNLAFNKPVSVSATNGTTNVAGNAVDGNTSTRWESPSSDPQWIYVDLGSNYNVTEVKLNWETACGKDYKIQVSTDASSWTDIKTVTGNTTAGVIDYTGLSGLGRYVRMYGTARATVWGYSLFEFEVYGTQNNNIAVTGVSVSPTSLTLTSVGATGQLTATVSPSNATNKTVSWSSSNTGVATVSSSGLVTGVAAGTATITVTTQDQGKTATASITVTTTSSNLALNKPVTVSATNGTTNVASNAVDGNTSTRWESPFSDAQWIYVDLGSNYNVTEVKLNWENACGKDYKIQVSTDASSWIDIKTVTGNTTAGVIDYTGLSGTGRYVRMYGTTRATIYGYSLWEFEVYGTTNTKIDDRATGVTYSGYWSQGSNSNFYQSTETYSNSANAYCQYTFTGTGITWYGEKNNSIGIAQVYIDGVLDQSVDGYSATSLYQQTLYTKTGLTQASHTIKIVVTGTKNASASGVYEQIDALEYTSGGSSLKSALVAPDITEIGKGAFSASVFPNPITSQSILEINSPDEKSDITIRIIDINGKVIYSNNLNFLGEMRLPVNLDNAPNGVYILQVQQGGQVINKRLIK